MCVVQHDPHDILRGGIVNTFLADFHLRFFLWKAVIHVQAILHIVGQVYLFNSYV